MPDINSLPIKVLIVDDHFLHRQIVAEVMRDYKVGKIELVAEGNEARDLLARSQSFGVPFDIVFLDWNMPGLQGIDLLKHFRAQPAFNGTAFIMLTSESEKSQVLEAVKAGATAYIIKPVSKETIAKKFLEVIEWVNKKRLDAKKLPIKIK